MTTVESYSTVYRPEYVTKIEYQDRVDTKPIYSTVYRTVEQPVYLTESKVIPTYVTKTDFQVRYETSTDYSTFYKTKYEPKYFTATRYSTIYRTVTDTKYTRQLKTVTVTKPDIAYITKCEKDVDKLSSNVYIEVFPKDHDSENEIVEKHIHHNPHGIHQANLVHHHSTERHHRPRVAKKVEGAFGLNNPFDVKTDKNIELFPKESHDNQEYPGKDTNEDKSVITHEIPNFVSNFDSFGFDDDEFNSGRGKFIDDEFTSIPFLHNDKEEYKVADEFISLTFPEKEHRFKHDASFISPSIPEGNTKFDNEEKYVPLHEQFTDNEKFDEFNSYPRLPEEDSHYEDKDGYILLPPPSNDDKKFNPEEYFSLSSPHDTNEEFKDEGYNTGIHNSPERKGNLNDDDEFKPFSSLFKKNEDFENDDKFVFSRDQNNDRDYRNENNYISLSSPYSDKRNLKDEKKRHFSIPSVFENPKHTDKNNFTPIDGFELNAHEDNQPDNKEDIDALGEFIKYGFESPPPIYISPEPKDQLPYLLTDSYKGAPEGYGKFHKRRDVEAAEQNLVPLPLAPPDEIAELGLFGSSSKIFESTSDAKPLTFKQNGKRDMPNASSRELKQTDESDKSFSFIEDNDSNDEKSRFVEEHVLIRFQKKKPIQDK